jgi:hypothetical protein
MRTDSLRIAILALFACTVQQACAPAPIKGEARAESAPEALLQ